MELTEALTKLERPPPMFVYRITNHYIELGSFLRENYVAVFTKEIKVS